MQRYFNVHEEGINSVVVVLSYFVLEQLIKLPVSGENDELLKTAAQHSDYQEKWQTGVIFINETIDNIKICSAYVK